jgi:DNA-binding transcriptional MocR family regulator
MNYPINQNISAIPTNPLRRLFEQATPNALNLASGHPAQELADTEGLIMATSKASQDLQAWRYGASKGDSDLIQLLSKTYCLSDDDDMVITAGAQQGIDLVLRTLAQPKGILLVPEQVYPAALSTAIMNGFTPVTYKIEEEDETLSELRELVKDIKQSCVLYVLPTFANPSGKTLSLYQRKHLLELAREFDLPILEDDPYRELWFNKTPPPTLYQLNKMSHSNALVIHLGSFSKIMSPGLRVGWVQGPKALLAHIIKVRQSSDLQPNSLAQRVVYQYLMSNRLTSHLSTMRTSLSSIHQAFVAPLRDIGMTQLNVEGGLFVMANIGKKVTAQSLCDYLLKENIIVVPGNAFSLNQEAANHNIRLCFGALTQDNAAQAGARLANVSRNII